MAGAASVTSSSTAARWQALPANVRAHPFLAGVVTLCFLLIAGIGVFVVYPELAGVYHWRKAQQALAAYDLPRARTHLQRCLDVWPRSSETQFLMARTCRRDGDFTAARAHLLEAERLHWVPALVDLERLLMEAQAGVVQPVEEKLNRFLESRPDERRVILEALVIGSLQGNFLDDAFRWSSRWVEAYSNDYQAHLLRGRVLERGLRHDLAAKEYEQALECKPGDKAAHLGLAEMLLHNGAYALALPHFRACLQDEPQHAAALLGVARCQRFLSPPEAALATLDGLISHHPEDAEALLLRGQLELEHGTADKALSWLTRAEQLQPYDLDTAQALATAYRLLNRKEEAQRYETKRQQIERDLRRMEELTKEIIDSPHNAELRCEAGTTLLRLGQEQQAARWLASALLIDPQHQPTKKALAACLPKLGDPQLVEHYRRILQVE